MANNIINSDLNQYNPKSQPVLDTVKAVYQELYNLFGTDENERLFRPEIVGSIEDELFESLDDDSSFSVLAKQIKRVELFVPRALPNFQKSTVELDQDNNSYVLNLVFQVKGAGNTYFEFTGSFLK